MARIIIGFMGSGKSTISSLLDKDYIDMDALITERIGMSIADFFEKEGEAKFREIESQVLAELVDSDHVISTGGGVVINPINREILAKILKPSTLKLILKSFMTALKMIAKMSVRYLLITVKKRSRLSLMDVETCMSLRLPALLKLLAKHQKKLLRKLDESWLFRTKWFFYAQCCG